MEALRREALDFMRTFQRMYLEQRDIQGLLSIMDPEVTWMGSGGMLPRHGLAETGADLEAELREYPSPFLITESKMDAIPLSSDACIVTGRLCARPVEGAAVAGLRCRITLVCARGEGGMRLMHLHISAPDRDQVWGEHYVRERTLREQEAIRRQIDHVRTRLEERSAELEDLMEHISGGMHQCSVDGGLTLLSVSPSFLNLCGYSREELRTRFQDRLMELICPQDRTQVLQQLRSARAAGESVELEYRIQRGDGQTVWLLSRGTIHTGADGQESVYSVVLDVTRRKHMEEDLRLSLERHRIIMEQSTDVIFEWDLAADKLFFSSNWKKKFGYTPASDHLSQHLGTSVHIHPDDRDGFMAAVGALTTGTPYVELELRLQGRGDRYFWCRIRATVQNDTSGTPIKVVGIIADIDADKRHQQQLMDQASKDALTGLLNRSTLQARVEAHLMESLGPHALMIMDLDGFKSINDCFGHMCGDAVLSDTAAALRRVFRRGDILGRIGGDEFLIFLPDVGSRETAARKAQELLAAISGILVNDTARLSCSLGVAMAPADATDYEQLFQLADQALYQVKKAGKGSFAFSQSDGHTPAPQTPAASAVNRTIDSEVGALDQLLSQYAMRMLYTSSDIHTSIRKMLEIAGRACDVSRAYIFENAPDGQSCRNTFEWCAEGVEPQIHNLQNCVYADMVDYPQNFDENGIFCCRDIRELPQQNYNDLAPQGIVSMLQCAIRDEGRMIGFVGFDECRVSRMWTDGQARALSLVANLLGNQLVKERLKERLALLERELAQCQSAASSQE